jgi:2-methylcitrate dehydratase PrpD
MSATRALAEFSAGLRIDALPDSIQTLLPTLMVDYFRAGAIGGRQSWVGKAGQVLDALSGPRTCAILFSDAKADPVRAAYQNGVMAGSLDWDDSHIAAIIHPGIVIWPAAFAAAEVVGASGARLLEAAAAGYETAIRIGMSIQPDHSLRGFQGTPTCGVFGAAIAAGLLLGLDAGGLQNALGLAASYASGLSQFFISGSDVKRLHAGKAAAAGMEIALLARAGMTGPADAIEGAQGFCRAASDTFDPAIITDGLGERFWLEGISLKVHAGTVRLQAAIEAVEHICRQGVVPADIARIEIGVPRILIGKLTWNAPVDQQQAQMSAPFAVAMTAFLIHARSRPLIVGIDDFGTMVTDPVVRDLASRTECVFDSEIDAAMTKEVVPARVTVTLHDGRILEHRVMRPKGCPDNKITGQEVRDRYRLMVTPIRTTVEIESWLAKAADVHKLPLAVDLMS